MAEMRVTEMVNRLRKLQADAPDIIASAVITADSFFLAPRTEIEIGYYLP